MHYLDYNEKQQHGTNDFPIAFYHVAEQHPRYHMPFHWHRELEIIRILEGNLQLYLEDMEISASVGDILFINGGWIHGGTPKNCIYECAVFDLKSLLMHTEGCKQYLLPLLGHDILLPSYFSKEQAETLGLHAAVWQLFETLSYAAFGWELSTLGHMYTIFGILFSHRLCLPADATSRQHTKKTAQLKSVLEYIDSNYQNPITLDELAHVAGMSPKYFCRCFQIMAHRTPIDYLNYYRIERACLLLNTSDLSVTETAFACGFNDSGYFIRTFKKYMGVTPKQYGMRTNFR